MYQKTFVCLCRWTISRIYIPFPIWSMLCQIWITYINFKTYEEHLQELGHAQTDRQTNQKHKHFSILLESVKKKSIYVQTIWLFKMSLGDYWNSNLHMSFPEWRFTWFILHYISKGLERAWSSTQIGNFSNNISLKQYWNQLSK